MTAQAHASQTNSSTKREKAIEEHSYPALMGKLPSLSLPCMYRKTNQPAIDPEGNIYHCLEHLGVPSYSVGNVCSGKMSFAKISGMAFMGDPLTMRNAVNAMSCLYAAEDARRTSCNAKTGTTRPIVLLTKNIFQKCCHTYTNASSKKDKNK